MEDRLHFLKKVIPFNLLPEEVLAGLVPATFGGVVIDGREVREPGPERAVVFQSASLLPWLTARDNVVLAARGRSGRQSPAARAEHYLDLVGVADAADQLRKP